MSIEKKLLVIQVAGLGCNLVHRFGKDGLADLKFRPMQTAFPAVTCAVQAAFRTGLSPERSGMPANGFYDRRLNKVMFWEQSSSLVQGERIWEEYRSQGKTVAMLFWQQSLGESADIILSPAPIHKHHGGMIQDCYSKPAGLYAQVSAKLGRGFNLKDYWGPLASTKSSQWIAEATVCVLQSDDAPDLCFTYLPAMDYDLQKYGVAHEKSEAVLSVLVGQLEYLYKAAADAGYEVLVFGDYAIVDADKDVVYPNRILRDAGLMETRQVKGMLYPDFYQGRAFAVVDHEIALIYVRNPDDKGEVAELLKSSEGVSSVDDAYNLKGGMSADLVVSADDGCWFAYPWWIDKKEAPDFATHVDIHSKPGYDPCELFFGRFPWQISHDADMVKGTHGKVGEGREVCWASTMWDDDVEDVLELGNRVKGYLTG